MKRVNCRVVAPLLFAGIALCSGCNHPDHPTNPIAGTLGQPSVSLSAAFSREPSSTLTKGSGILATDSLQIDSAVVVLQRIKFEMHNHEDLNDSVSQRDSGGDDRDYNVILKGPFVVHVRDTLTITFANQILPAGVYDGIKFKIHRIQRGERHEDSDEFNHHPVVMNDSILPGSSVVIWGRVRKNGEWVTFIYRYNGEAEFKVKGELIVPAATSSVNVVLHFSADSWFRNPFNGARLDPSSKSFAMRALIDAAIRKSFQDGRCRREFGFLKIPFFMGS